jgi:hypothetical protein
MNVRLDPAYFVNEDSRSVDAPAAQVVMGDRFYLGDEEGQAPLGVPNDV